MAFADKLEAALKILGFEVLIDRQEIYAFEDWWKRIQALIGGADTVVFVLSPDAVKSEVALKEVSHAATLNKKFAPIVCRRVDDSAVPDALRRLNFIFFDEPERFNDSVRELAEALQTDIVWIRRHTEFGDTARRWAEGGRPGGMLLRPPVLDQAEAWLAFRPGEAPAPTAETEAFISESRKATLSTQRLQRFVLGSIFALLMAVVLGLVGWINQAYIADEWRWYRIERPFGSANILPYVLARAAEQSLKPDPKQSFRECPPKQEGKDYCPDMVVVPAGSFLMGSLPTDKNVRKKNEMPQHRVTIARPFAVSRFQLTFDEWDTCARDGHCRQDVTDFRWGRGQLPVIEVSWNDAQQYVAWLSKVSGKPYRLLTEAEYEYATRAGTTTAYPWGDDVKLNEQAMTNCNGCGSQWDNKQTAPVGSFAANRFGLYDMVGNVFEWVEDCFHPSYEVGTPEGKVDAPVDGSEWTTACPDVDTRVVRGGRWDRTPDYLRSAFRAGDHTDARGNTLGFRVARTLLSR